MKSAASSFFSHVLGNIDIEFLMNSRNISFHKLKWFSHSHHFWKTTKNTQLKFNIFYWITSGAMISNAFCTSDVIFFMSNEILQSIYFWLKVLSIFNKNNDFGHHQKPSNFFILRPPQNRPLFNLHLSLILTLLVRSVPSPFWHIFVVAQNAIYFSFYYVFKTFSITNNKKSMELKRNFTDLIENQ